MIDLRNWGTQRAEGLRCICGNDAVYFRTFAIDNVTVNELYCPNCGIMMRSPTTDENGQWLRRHWATIHGKGGTYGKDKADPV